MAEHRPIQPAIDHNADASGASERVTGTAAASISHRVAPPSADDAPAGDTRVDHRFGWIRELIANEGAGIRRMLWRILGREHDVLDAYQDCFCKLASLSGRANLHNARAYAYRTAANIAVEMLRVRKRRAVHWPAIAAGRATSDDGDGETPDGVAASDRQESLRRAVAQLPAHLRNVVVLRDLSRMSYEEVGRILRIEPATARVYRRHAVVRLAELLEEGAET